MTEFIASFPPIQSAVKIDGQGDGARVQLDVPRSHIAGLLEAWAEYAGKSFVVKISADQWAEDTDDGMPF